MQNYELGKAFVCRRELSDFLHKGVPTSECTCVSNKIVQFASKVGPLHHFEKESAKAPWASDKWKKGERVVEKSKGAEVKISLCAITKHQVAFFCN